MVFIFRPSEANNVNRKLNNLLRRTAGASGVDAETEIEFREAKPDQLKPLENAVSTGTLGGHRVLPVITAGKYCSINKKERNKHTNKQTINKQINKQKKTYLISGKHIVKFIIKQRL